ncbi:MAG: iron-containing alcohol dehydrogenase, partial [Phycisphaeraceae bacterium]
TNGVYDAVMGSLGDRAVHEFGGIQPNPTLESLEPAIELVRREGVDFLLAVGGGSVIDATKFITMAAHYDGDPWDILEAHMIGGNPLATDDLLARTPTTAIPLGAVLTLPATGSEANHGAVISSTKRGQKREFEHESVFPVFSILDPDVTASVPPRQIANGVADAFVHVLEQYLTYPAAAPLQDRFAESILLTLTEDGPRWLADAQDADARASVMWCATMALNTLLACGVPGDWTSHAVGHELTALHGIDHARTLAIVVPRVLEEAKASKREKLLQYGERVFGIADGPDDQRVDAAIAATERFFQSLDIPTRLGQYVDAPDEAPRAVSDRLASRGVTELGERGEITPERVERILAASL